MFRCFFLLLAVVLSGCAAQKSEVTVPATPPPEVPAVISLEALPSFSDPRSGIGVWAFSGGELTGLLPLNEGILLFSDSGSETTLTVWNGSALSISRRLGFSLSADDCMVHSNGKSISFFDPRTARTVLLDDSLEELDTIESPQELMGTPLLSPDQRVLYYCTPSALRALELDTGISRILKECAYPFQTVTGAILDGTVLTVSISDGGKESVLYLSADTGTLLSHRKQAPAIHTTGTRYGARNPGSSLLLFGDRTGQPQLLLPRHPEGTCLPLSGEAAVSFFSPDDGETIMDLYDLRTGNRTASASLSGKIRTEAACMTADGRVWFSGSCNDMTAVFGWNSSCSPVEDPAKYSHVYHTKDTPDEDGLAQCALYARQITDQYGIPVCLQVDTSDPLFGDHILEPEHLVPVLHRELELLEARLSLYPPEFLQTLAGEYSSLEILLVKQIRSRSSPNREETLPGILLRDGHRACMVLVTGEHEDTNLFQQISLLTETAILTRSTAYDQWENLNPSGFSYYPSFGTDERMDGREWLQPGRESFLNTASMRSAREDRAQIMSFAMMPGNSRLFQSPYLQAKLRCLCLGIREAFALTDSPEPPLWEQYLHSPLSSEP